MPNREPTKAEAPQETLGLAVLHMVLTPGSAHGYATVARLEQVSAGALRLNRVTF